MDQVVKLRIRWPHSGREEEHFFSHATYAYATYQSLVTGMTMSEKPAYEIVPVVVHSEAINCLMFP